MEKLIDKIKGREELMKLNTEQLYTLAEEIREHIIDCTAECGGHLASSLGAVEMTIALHRVLRLPNDKIVWDVGHQSYAHKILTGRKDQLKTLRKLGGECGFCDPEASGYDSYISGHTSTSLSLALGAVCARDTLGEKYTVAAVIGDGALSGGLANEALNNIGQEQRRMLMILNDNEMSISENVGAMSNYLTRARTSAGYVKSKRGIDSALEKLPRYGDAIARFMRNAKEHVKYLVSPGVIFEELGITYLGPIDGHDIRAMEEVFRRAVKLDEPVIVHVVTKKGKGYSFAEKEPKKYHGVGPFDKNEGVTQSGAETYSSVFGDEISRIARENSRVAVITPAMMIGSGLEGYAKEFPDRFYDVGIAEGHAVTFAAGLAGSGMVPVVSLYSTFAQRAYDSIVHDVALSNLHVVFAIDRAGLVPGDGKTHQGIFDISFFSSVPNVKILSPCSFEELRKMLCYAVEECEGPVVVRYPRGANQFVNKELGDFVLSKADVVKKGDKVTILAEGVAMPSAAGAGELLEGKGITCEVINARTIQPVDIGTISESVKKTGRLVCVEQSMRRGGMGENVCGLLAQRGVECEFLSVALDEFVTHGGYDEIEKKYAFDSESIAERIEKEWFDGEEKA
ncbi:MAG: 1-deoxy-D-xylulose-5-phosphate synthase [Clostridia bacterium]|nr:1-deoxy-D-xylulose-5-phosphate synthase [Clostridia bacterium]